MLMTDPTFRPLSGIAAALDVLKAIATRHHADRRLAYRFVTWAFMDLHVRRLLRHLSPL